MEDTESRAQQATSHRRSRNPHQRRVAGRREELGGCPLNTARLVSDVREGPASGYIKYSPQFSSVQFTIRGSPYSSLHRHCERMCVGRATLRRAAHHLP